jgi:hypothetical protein
MENAPLSSAEAKAELTFLEELLYMESVMAEKDAIDEAILERAELRRQVQLLEDLEQSSAKRRYKGYSRIEEPSRYLKKAFPKLSSEALKALRQRVLTSCAHAKGYSLANVLAKSRRFSASARIRAKRRPTYRAGGCLRYSGPNGRRPHHPDPATMLMIDLLLAFDDRNGKRRFDLVFTFVLQTFYGEVEDIESVRRKLKDRLTQFIKRNPGVQVGSWLIHE